MTEAFVYLLGVMVVVFSIFAIISLVVAIVAYIFEAIGMYSISRRRRVGTSGLAWIPIARTFKLGQLADDAIENKRQKRTHYMILMPLMIIIGVIITFVGIFITALSLNIPQTAWSALIGSDWNSLYSITITYHDCSSTGIIMGVIFTLIGCIVSVIGVVMQNICLYHIYKSCSKKYVSCFVLSLIFPFLSAFFLFAIRKQDNEFYYKKLNV